MGITLERIHAETTDEEWIPTFLNTSSNQLIHKLVSLKNLAIYMNPSTFPSSFTDIQLLNKQMSKWVRIQPIILFFLFFLAIFFDS